MKKNKQKIFSGDWLDFHPYSNSVNSDLYYVQLANKVYDALDNAIENSADTEYLFLNHDEKKQLSCILTAYFEDIISQTNIWNTFTRLMKGYTDKWLPYYDTSDYAEEEINKEDLQFLCWHYLTQINECQIPISPLDKLFEGIAEAVYPLFDEAFESAPENEKLQSFFHIEEETSLFEIQNKFFWLGTESYLLYFNNRDLEKELDDVVNVANEHQMEDDLPSMVDMVMTDFVFNNVIEFFGLTSAQWLAHILGEEHELYDALMEMSEKKSGYFIFQEQDSMYAQFKHVATGEVLHVINRSLQGYPKDFKSSEVVVYAGFVKWQGEWWFFGDLRGYEAAPELLDEIAKREEEINLFKEDEDMILSDEYQAEYVEKALAIEREGNPKEDELDIYWSLLYDENVSSEYLTKAVKANKYPSLSFPGEKGSQLMLDDIDFTLSYFRRSKYTGI